MGIKSGPVTQESGILATLRHGGIIDIIAICSMNYSNGQKPKPNPEPNPEPVSLIGFLV